MDKKVVIQKTRIQLLLIGLVWALLWIIPWGNMFTIRGNLYLVFLVDMIRVGVALTTFIFPGVLLYWMLNQKESAFHVTWGLIPIGFTLSVTLVGLIGLFGRVAGFSFETVKALFVFSGLFELLLLIFFTPEITTRTNFSPISFRVLLENAPLLLVVILAGLLTFHDHLLFIDDTTYLAYMTNWQHSTHLNFNNIIHGGNIIEVERFWLAMYPMGQALLSDSSGVPGLLLMSNYLELFLVPMAVIASYGLARELGLSRKVSVIAVLFQISIYCWMVGEEWPVGTWFFQSMAEDKVSAVFLLAPAFIVFVSRYVRQPTTSNLVFVLLSGMSITLTHPVSLFFSCIVAFGIGIFSWISTKKGWRELLRLAVIFVILVLPYVVIRLYDYSSQVGFALDPNRAGASFQIDKYTNAVNEVFYGINPGVLKFFDIQPQSHFYGSYQFVRLFPFILMVIAGVLAIMNLKKGPIHWYISTCVLLVVFVTIPYTGWILGYFTDARLISRASWFSPYGLGWVVVLMSISDWLKRSQILKSLEKSNFYGLINLSFVSLIICIIFVGPTLLFGIIPRTSFYFDKLKHNKELAEVGAYIDQTTTGQVTSIALSYSDTQLLPGVSAHTNLISFREEKDDNGHNFFMSVDEIHERIDASNAIRSLDQTLSGEEKCSSFEKFNVRFILADTENVELYKNMLGECPVQVHEAFTTGDMVLLEIK